MTHEEIRSQLFHHIKNHADTNASFRQCMEKMGFFTALDFLEEMTVIFEHMMEQQNIHQHQRERESVG